LLTGQMLCPRSPPDSLASFTGVVVPEEKWLVKGICAYVPQVMRYISLADGRIFTDMVGAIGGVAP
jgi:hypothetical protein